MTNGEKYVTAHERAKAFTEYCRAAELNHRENVGAFMWLNLEAEEEKILPCPFCGSKCEVSEDGMNVVCQACGYNGPVYGCYDMAVEAHNRVARAVMEAKESEAK